MHEDHADNHSWTNHPPPCSVTPLGAISYLAGYFVGSLFVGDASRAAELAPGLAARRKGGTGLSCAGTALGEAAGISGMGGSLCDSHRPLSLHLLRVIAQRA